MVTEGKKQTSLELINFVGFIHRKYSGTLKTQGKYYICTNII